jgi:hypothetical protein
MKKRILASILMAVMMLSAVGDVQVFADPVAQLDVVSQQDQNRYVRDDGVVFTLSSTSLGVTTPLGGTSMNLFSTDEQIVLNFNSLLRSHGFRHMDGSVIAWARGGSFPMAENQSRITDPRRIGDSFLRSDGLQTAWLADNHIMVSAGNVTTVSFSLENPDEVRYVNQSLLAPAGIRPICDEIFAWAHISAPQL